MKKSIAILSAVLFVIIGFALPIQANAADETTVVQVITINTNGNTAAWLEAYKPLSARLDKLNTRATAHVYEAQFAGTETGMLNIVVKFPSMAYMEERRLKNQGDPEIGKLLPALMKTGMNVEANSLFRDMAPDQARDLYSAVYQVYSIDTHGNNNAFIEASKKIHDRWLKVNKESTVRIYEAMFAGENTGLIVIAVGFPNMAYMEGTDDRSASDKKLSELFSERDKIGATVVSVSLITDVTP